MANDDIFNDNEQPHELHVIVFEGVCVCMRKLTNNVTRTVISHQCYATLQEQRNVTMFSFVFNWGKEFRPHA